MQKRPVPKNFKYYFMSDFHGLKFNIGPFVKIENIFSQNIDLIEHKLSMNNQVSGEVLVTL
jgi:hypothetical protein